MMTNGDRMDTGLDQLFDRLNRDFFERRLAKHRVRTRISRSGERGFLDEAGQTIWICAGADLRSTLLHEMCHIGTPGHGRAFRAKLKRLAARGERWAHAERAYYLRKERGIPAGGWRFFNELAMAMR
jgi:hypothetical protein